MAADNRRKKILELFFIILLVNNLKKLLDFSSYIMVLKKPNSLCLKVLDIKKYWQLPIFAFLLSSALKCLTSVFEMGTGEPLCYFHQYIYFILS